MHHRLAVSPDAESLASAAAIHVATSAADAVADRGEFHFAVSGGTTPRAMFAQLGELDMPWGSTVIYQVDERIAPAGDPNRNLTNLTRALAGAPATVVAMPVEDPAPDIAADRYGSRLPDAFDLVHLGIGPDGHTASLVPGDDVLEVVDRPVAVTGSTYQGHRRMTLTYPALARARHLLWLVAGRSKADVLARLLAGDQTIPAGRVTAADSLIMADSSAAGDDSAAGDSSAEGDGSRSEPAGEA